MVITGQLTICKKENYDKINNRTTQVARKVMYSKLTQNNDLGGTIQNDEGAARRRRRNATPAAIF